MNHWQKEGVKSILLSGTGIGRKLILLIDVVAVPEVFVGKLNYALFITEPHSWTNPETMEI